MARHQSACHNERSASCATAGMVFMRKIVVSLSTLFAFVLLCSAPPAHAVSKEMVQLQTQVQQLQDALQHLQETQDQQTERAAARGAADCGQLSGTSARR